MDNLKLTAVLNHTIIFMYPVGEIWSDINQPENHFLFYCF